jgi:hypothetical protein
VFDLRIVVSAAMGSSCIERIDSSLILMRNELTPGDCNTNGPMQAQYLGRMTPDRYTHY